MLFVMLTGIFPYRGSTDEELYRKINTADHPQPEGTSRRAIHLLSKMFAIDPEERITAEGVWMMLFRCLDMPGWMIQRHPRELRTPASIKNIQILSACLAPKKNHLHPNIKRASPIRRTWMKDSIWEKRLKILQANSHRILVKVVSKEQWWILCESRAKLLRDSVVKIKLR